MAETAAHGKVRRTAGGRSHDRIAPPGWRALSQDRPPILTLAGGFALLLLAAITAGWLAVESRAAFDRVALSLSIRQSVAVLLSTLQDAETGQRGFLLTADEAYLAPYARARGRVLATEPALAALVADMPAQVARMQRLAPLINAKMAELDRTVTLARQDRLEEAMAIVRDDSGLATMDEIRAILAALDATERTALADHAAEAAHNNRLLLIAIAVAILGALLLGLVLAAGAWRRLAAAEADAEALEKVVNARTADLEREKARAEALLDEASHRVGNALALVSAFIGMQARVSPATRPALEAVRSRISAIAATQRRLRLMPGQDAVDVAPFLAGLVEDFRRTLPDARIDVTLDAAPLTLPSRDATSLGVIAMELASNAVKHAYPGAMRGTVAIRLVPEGDAWLLEVSDDGTGATADAEPDGEGQHGEGLGGTVIDAMAQVLGATIDRAPVSGKAPRPGTRVRVLLPARAPAAP
jgi:two-component sensor histidine kinase